MNAYEVLKKDFIECMSTKEDRLKHCPIKPIVDIGKIDGVVTKTYSVLPACDRAGSYGVKGIFIDDVSGESTETYDLNGMPIPYSGKTVLRCALMNRLTLEIMEMSDAHRIGFIGNGKINLETAKALSQSQKRSFVIHGACGRWGKNLELFQQHGETVVDVDFSILNKCDVVFVCTNSFAKESLISTDQLACGRIVALDCGYTLGPSFRSKYANVSDYPEQLMNYFAEEFPFDSALCDFIALTEWEKARLSLSACENVAVYLHGCGISDLSIAKCVHQNELKH